MTEEQKLAFNEFREDIKRRIKKGELPESYRDKEIRKQWTDPKTGKVVKTKYRTVLRSTLWAAEQSWKLENGVD